MEELKYVAAVKKWNSESRASGEALKASPVWKLLQKVWPPEAGPVDEKALRVFDTIDWFVALVERECGCVLNEENLGVLEVLSKRSRKRDPKERG
jgi:hypothetical protein